MILSKVLNFLCGNLMSRTMLFVLVPLIIASYFGILGVAALLTPESYDWRNNSISQLLYARENPEFHYIASICVASFGVLMIPFAGYIRRRLHSAAPTAARIGAVVFFVGCICLTLSGLITGGWTCWRPSISLSAIQIWSPIPWSSPLQWLGSIHIG